MRLLVKIPSRERRSQFFNVLNRAQRMRVLKDTHFLITLDSNDPIMTSHEVRNTLKLWGNLSVHYGTSKSKIDAVNRDMDKAGEWDVLLLLSDDMHVLESKYDKIICDAMAEHFPDTDGVLWFNDGFTKDKLNTLVIIGRKYYERFGFIYNPVYKSLFSDNEFTDISRMLGKVKYFDRVIIQHRHPMNVRGIQLDNLYRKNDSYFNQDKKTYFDRKERNFDLLPGDIITDITGA